MKTIWRLKTGQERRFRAGHPWVYSNEIQSSPAGVGAGEPVELHDASGKFLARGYGNPHSLICFRSLSRDSEDLAPWDGVSLQRKLFQALRIRQRLGMLGTSCRILFGEADGFPGLILDRYVSEQQEQIWVFQPQTAGADRLCEALLRDFEEVLEQARQAEVPLVSWEKTSLILRKDARSREREGLEKFPVQVARHSASRPDLSKIAVSAVSWGSGIFLFADLLEGQKTGYFLDQSLNLEMAGRVFLGHPARSKGEAFRILDLCSYLGQWGVALGRQAQLQGYRPSVLAVDRSEKALVLAQENFEKNGITGSVLRADLPGAFSELEQGGFDLVICDPPALIQSRKDLPQGKRAYLQWNTQAFDRLRPSGRLITCSCSGLLPEEEFLSLAQHAFERSQAGRASGRTLRWIARGGQAPDHPWMASFPEGRYLKCWMGMIDSS